MGVRVCVLEKKKIEKESESVCLCVSVFWKEIIGCVCVRERERA